MDDLVFTNDYPLLKRARDLLASCSLGQVPGGADLLADLQTRLETLYPTAPLLEADESELYACEVCGKRLQVKRVADEKAKIAIDGRTGQLIWATEYIEIEVTGSAVVCCACGEVSTRLRYDREHGRLAVRCSNCGGDCSMEGGVRSMLVDVAGHTRALCSLDCEQSFQCEP